VAARRAIAVAVAVATAAIGHLGCATVPAARRFRPVTAEDAATALAAWGRLRDRAAALPAAHLLYDAKLESGGLARVPGTLAVSYDGTDIRTATLTGPFGKRLAEYRDGVVRGEDRRAFVIEPEVLRAVLAGSWNGAAPSVEGRDEDDYLLTWGGTAHVVAVLDAATQSLRSLDLESETGHLEVTYGGTADPWPARITMRDEGSGRSLVLKLLAVERTAAAVARAPGR
jgi:hypothetical protein